MIPNVQIRQILLLLLIAGLLGLIFWNLQSFLPAMLGAYTLYVLLRNPVIYFTETRNWNKKAVVAGLMLASFMVVLLPVYGLIGLLSGKVRAGFQNSEQIRQSVETVISNLETRIGFHFFTAERIQNASNWAVQEGTNMLNATLGGLLMLIIAFFILWFMLMGGKKMEHSFFNWLPLKAENINYLRRELNDLVNSNAIGIPLMGVIQGLAGLIGYSIAGVDDLWFWVFLTFVAGMIPFLGVMLAFLPLALVLFSKGENGSATFILIYGFAVIGSVDNLARMWLLTKIGHTHPLVTLFGVIVGLKLFGFVGFIFGPILIAMCLLLLKIYTKEFNKNGVISTDKSGV